MSFTSTINCPGCGMPIIFDSQLLLSGSSFSCTNEACNVSISLSREDQNKVSSAFNKFESLKQESERAIKHAQDE
ncbi:hypothetical protein [Flocculibacter collagenilyticus]|uniref:hypothetical protein n=1 Tax=Flocculibacter collagenilyticus TaxID=2744479 RepID=UPI0018F784C9|nr:hypothetical protein [Flocculibacter collagenilyticus]